MRENLDVSITAARQRGEALDHVLLYGPPGLGKTTLAYVIGNELGVPVRATSGPVLERPGDLAAILTNLKAREVLFIDEVHRMSPAIEEIPLPGDGGLRARHRHRPGAGRAVGQAAAAAVHADWRDDACRAADVAAARAVRHRPPARLLRGDRSRRDRRPVGAHSRRRDRAGGGGRDRAPVARHAAHRQPAAAPRPRLRAGEGGRPHHARRSARTRSSCSRSTRTASTRPIAGCCKTIIDKFCGGPVGLNSLAAAIGEEKDAIEDIYEPYLIQIGFLDRTPRGRVATARAYEYFGLHGPGKDRLW